MTTNMDEQMARATAIVKIMEDVTERAFDLSDFIYALAVCGLVLEPGEEIRRTLTELK